MKLINFRVPLFLAVAFILGIFSCYEWYLGDFYFGLAVALLLAVMTIVFALKRFSARKIAIAMLVVALLGFAITRLSLYRMESRQVYGDEVTLTGRVCDLNRNTSESGAYYLEDCTLSDGQRLRGRVQLRFSGTSLHTGDAVTVSGKLTSTYAIKSTVSSYLIRNNINYELTDVEIVSRSSGELKLDEKARKYIYDLTQDYMPSCGNIMYALLTGDRGAISDDVNYAFSRAGILHLLAVSGLHVGFIVALVCFALKRLRLRPIVECMIVVVPLVFYAYICNFTPSVMRAITMVVCSYIARACYGRYDMLSGISWAALFILIVQPFYLFDVGFQLSFLSVYGIATMYAALDRLLNRRKIKKFFRYLINSMLISLSCVVATVFTVAINFGEVPIFSALLNTLVIPIVSVVFTLGIFGLIPSVFHYLLLAADYLLRIVVALAQAVAKLSFSTVAIAAVAISTVIVVAMLFVVGGYVNINKLGKRIFYPVCAALLVCSMVFAAVPKPARNQAFVAVSGNGSAVAAVSDSGEAALVVDFNTYSNVYSAVRYLQQFDLSSCTLYVTDCSQATQVAVHLIARLPIDKVYLLGTDGSRVIETEFGERGVSVINQVPNSTTGNHIHVHSYFGAGLMGVSVSVDEIDICVVCSGNFADELLDMGIAADVFVLPEASSTYSEKNMLTLTAYQSAFAYNYGANKCGNFTIGQKGGKILLSFR